MTPKNTQVKVSSVADIYISDHGSVVLFQPLTAAAHEWMEANINPESWRWFGPSLAVDQRYAGALIDGALEDGLEVLL